MMPGKDRELLFFSVAFLEYYKFLLYVAEKMWIQTNNKRQ